MSFEDLVNEAYRESKSLLSVGLDLSPLVVPPRYSMEEYMENIIRTTYKHALAYKPNLSCYVGKDEGTKLLKKGCKLAHEYGRLFIIDAKLNDVGHTAREYARSYLEEMDADACTVNPLPFLDDTIGSTFPYLSEGKAIFVLVYTTSPHSQMSWENFYINNLPAWKFVALKVANDWSQKYVGKDYSCIGIVGAPRRKEIAKKIREICDTQIDLVPGLGVQGVPLSILRYLIKKRTYFPGIIANVGRSIIKEWKEYPGEDPIKIVEREAEKWKKKIMKAVR